MRRRTSESIAVKQLILEDRALGGCLEKVAQETLRTLTAGGKVLLFGNGGSASDAQHIAAELVGRYKLERRGLAAIALTANTTSLTAIANDYAYERVFARQVEALAAPGDVALGISTSGNSPSVLRGVQAAKTRGAITVGLTGKSGGRLKAEVDYCVQVPSAETARIQEVHILIGHILCEFVEGEIFRAPNGTRQRRCTGPAEPWRGHG
ncbi:MAG TPA: D-sedoheptulose 7-phosphate isomerase [Terriglobia bacterium]|nr:D-sedoheptulose 7-phosphate isomerase [Terriglobia bacterium]